LYIVSDRQRQTLTDSPVLAGFEDRVYICELPLEAHGNIGINALDFGGQLIIPGHNFDIAANVKNYTLEDRTNLIASLYLDGNRMAQTDFSINGNGETSVRFSRSVSNPGFHAGPVYVSAGRYQTPDFMPVMLKFPMINS